MITSTTVQTKFGHDLARKKKKKMEILCRMGKKEENKVQIKNFKYYK